MERARRRRWEATVPRTIVIVAVVSSLTLATMLWFVSRAVDRASLFLVQGQASELIAEAQDWLRALHRRPQPGDFDEFLRAHWGAGLRYIALVRPRSGELQTYSGTPAAALDATAVHRLRSMAPEPVGDRVRVMLGPPDRPADARPASGPPEWGPPDWGPGGPGSEPRRAG